MGENTRTCCCECDHSEAALLARIGELAAEYRGKEGSLIQVLHMAQGIYGYLPIEVQIMIAEASTDRIAEVLESEPTIVDPKQPADFMEEKKGQVEFRDVSFRYPGAEEPVLHHLNFTAQPGKTTAFIGSTGSGKSTLINLVPRFFDASEGEVLVDGVNVRDVSQHELHERIGYVPQISQLMRKRTIEENLAMASMIGRGRRKVPMEERIRKALCMVGLKDVEKRYPVELSLGECRRVELARAIINSPSVLVLDELTASLDEDTIWDLFHLIGELNRLGTTVIMATHAKNFVNLMRKRVITLVDGRIFGDVRNGRYGDVM